MATHTVTNWWETCCKTGGKFLVGVILKYIGLHVSGIDTGLPMEFMLLCLNAVRAMTSWNSRNKCS